MYYILSPKKSEVKTLTSIRMKDINPTKKNCKMNIINIILGMGFVFFINVPTLSAQLGAVESPLPLDPSIRQGKLANGFTYYIKHVENASEKINMHLYAKTGILHQRQDQLDFAHALE